MLGNLYQSAGAFKLNEAQELFIDFKKILLATDGSKSAINATKHAIGWAKVFKAKVRAIFVDINCESANQTPKTIDQYLDSGNINKNGYNGLLVARQYAQNNDVPCEELVITGNVARSIIDNAEKFLPELIVIGNSEKSGIRRSLGSIADAVMKGTDIPVLVVSDT
ncbi:MAG TPA: universal stress protein [Anaerolineae bacterium]|nr:universal stress protein [Anaerolineae bacterium]